MPLQNRSTLKNFFRKGQLPAEGHFYDLIESMINKVDDGMSKTIDDGLMLSPIGTSKKLISFYRNIEDKNAAWSLEINSGDSNLHINNHLGDNILSLRNDGKVGINRSDPEYELDVNGTVGMMGRMGTFHTGKVLADGNWHPVLTELNGCHALEIVAGVGKKKTGKYALIHAIALSTFGDSNDCIDIKHAYYGGRGHKIDLRWTGSTYNYSLEMRTRSSYNGPYYIKYHIVSLWFDKFMDHSMESE